MQCRMPLKRNRPPEVCKETYCSRVAVAECCKGHRQLTHMEVSGFPVDSS